MSICTPASGSAVELLDHLLVVERIHFDADRRRGARLGRGCCRADLFDESLTQVERGDEQLAEALGLTEAGQVVEEVCDVRGDVLVRREQAEILVPSGGDGVVVAGADVRVSTQAVSIASNDERRLRVNLEPREAVDDMHAGLLEPARPFDVPLLVETCLQLDQADRLLAVFRRRDECRRQGRLVARPVHRRLERADLRIARSLRDEGLDARHKRVVRELDERVGSAAARRTRCARRER